MGELAIGWMFKDPRKSARIEWNDCVAPVSLTGAEIIDCILLDISATGARISVEVPEVVPDYFKLEIGERVGQMLPKCRVRWRSGNEVGVEFFGGT